MRVHRRGKRAKRVFAQMIQPSIAKKVCVTVLWMACGVKPGDDGFC
jgi:hypothetical protein